MSANKQLTFHILDIIARDEIIEHEDEETREVSYADDNDYAKGYNSSKKRALKITLFGKTAAGQAIRANIGGFEPFFYVALPSRASKHDALAALKSYLTGQGLNQELFSVEYEERRTFFGYNCRSTFPFAKISVQSLDYFRRAKNLFLDYKTSKPALKISGARLTTPFRSAPKVYEANLDPMLRFFHLRNIDPCGWATINGEEEPKHSTSECMEIDCDWLDIHSATGSVAPFMVASWDIETYSESGDFTLAKMDYGKVAKELFEHATSAENACELLLNILTDQPSVCSKIYPKRAIRPAREVAQKWISNSKLAACFAEHCAFAFHEKMTQDSRKKHIATIKDELNIILSRPERMQLEGDPIIQIGTILACKDSTISATGGNVERHIFVQPSCAPIEGVIVHECPNEARLILDWAAWIQEMNPDILIGYNVFGFDEKYISDRAEELDIADAEELQGLNRLHQEGSSLDIKQEQPDFKIEEKFLSSSALGDNFMYIWTMWGRLQVDLYHHVKRNAVLPSYKLDDVAKTYMSGKLDAIEYKEADGLLQFKAKGSVVADAKPGRFICLLDALGETITEKLPVVANEGGYISLRYSPAFGEEDDAQWRDAVKWVIVKDDMPYDELFECHRGSPEDRARVAAYCVQDCELVLDLYNKLDVFNTSMAMANVCTVPVGYIFTRGQGIKIESLMFKEAYKQGQVVEVLEAPANRMGRGLGSGGQDESYEGAIVLDPTIGLLESPVGVADFASLYPSTIVSENISHDTLVWVKDFDHDGYLIRHVWGSDEYDKPDQIPMTDIEFDLLVPDPEDHRKIKRKVSIGKRICRYAQDKEGTVPTIIKSLLAARKATRALIPKTQDPLKAALLDAQQNAYKITANSLYGQLGSGTFKLRLQALAASVTGYGRKQILFAKEIIDRFYGEKANNPLCSAKSDCKVVYGDSVTADTPVLLRAGGHTFMKEIGQLFTELNWDPYHKTKEFLDLSEQGIEVWTDTGFTPVRKLIRHRLAPNKKLFRITTPTGLVDVTEDHSLLLSDGSVAKPTDLTDNAELLHNDTLHLIDTPIEYTEGIPYTEAWFAKQPSTFVINCEHKIHAAMMYINARRQGYYVHIESASSRLTIYTFSKTPFTGKATIVKQQYQIVTPVNEYVYDFETENHHFAVGPGALVVHNTDSLFVQFNPQNPETGEVLKGRDARIAVIELTEEAGHLVTQALKAPHDFEFDKVFDPLLMFSKKRYAGRMHENADKPDDFVYKYMGIALKRRDNAPIVKNIYGAAMKKVLDDKDVAGAVEIVKQGVQELVEGKVPMTQLCITKSLRATYANPQSIAHKVLADRIGARDPGNAPAAGDRIAYAYIVPSTTSTSKLQGDRIETPQYIREKSLPLDYMHYINNQLKNPISQMFALLLEQMPGYSERMLPDDYDELNEDHKMTVRENIAAGLLFNEFLQFLDQQDANRKKVAFMSLFGGAVYTPKPVTFTRLKPIAGAPAPAPKKKGVQPTMSEFLSQVVLHKKMDEAKRKTAAAAAAKK